MEQVQSKIGGAVSEDLIANPEAVWYTSAATTPTNTAPCEALARFVGRTHGELSPFQRRGISLLDIGSGSGANTRYFLDEGYLCIAVDSSDDAYAHHHGPIEEYLKSCPGFDVIFDINTLCHVKDPPYEAIYGALKAGGKFFSIHPADGTEVDMTGKGYTFIADIGEMRAIIRAVFGDKFSIHKTTNWSGDTKINSWQIEAEK